MNLIYNGVDITESVSLTNGKLVDSGGGQADMATLAFSDTGKLWGGWNPSRNDTMEVKTGNFSTGKLFVHAIDYPDGVCTVRAVSVPRDAYRPRDKIWRKVSLMEVANDVANRCGLTLKTYDIADRKYKALTQQNMADLAFLTWLCLRESIAVKACNGNLVLFSELAFEQKTPQITIKRSDAEDAVTFRTGAALAGCTVKGATFGVGAFSGTAKDVNGTGAKTISETVWTQGEAQRFASGYLRAANKHFKTAELPMRSLTEVAGGSTVMLSGFGTGNDGNWYVETVSHDLKHTTSALQLRRALAY
ncbi:phage late control D family protein [Oscillibacter ruminantium]|uniref:phage late control D family protein n=1 Tax=Oscillibacter ruminantium TaxID=1263547 RepID=UPI0002DB384D|nr:hypothetical protein [Oscillibacter ruminantium]